MKGSLQKPPDSKARELLSNNHNIRLMMTAEIMAEHYHIRDINIAKGRMETTNPEDICKAAQEAKE